MNERSTRPSEMEWNADRSKYEEGCGSEEDNLCPDGKISLSIQNRIRLNVVWCVEQSNSLGYKNKVIRIFSTICAALKASAACKFRSILVWDCYSTLPHVS